MPLRLDNFLTLEPQTVIFSYLCEVFFKKDMSPKVKGYIVGAIAAATYGLNPLFAMPLYADGMGADAVLFYRYLAAVPIMGAMAAFRGRSLALHRRELLPMLFVGILMASSSLLLFESYNFMDAGIASTLLFVYPLMVAVIMAVFFRERLAPVTVLCIVMALGGIAMLFKGSDGATLSIAGTVLVMASSLTYAGYIVAVNRPGLREVPTVKLIFYLLVLGALLFALKIALTPGSSFAGPAHWYMWGCVLALAELPTVVSFICTTAAIQYIGPTPTAILGALEPVTAVVIGVCVFGERLTARDWTGLALIIVAVSLVVGGGRVTGYLVRFRKLFPRISRRKSI